MNAITKFSGTSSSSSRMDMNEAHESATKRRPPRLNHKKSKYGCMRCKARRVKCDEKHPVCGGCQRHEVPCVYAEATEPAPISIPNNGSQPHPAPLRNGPRQHDDLVNGDLAESKDRRYEELKLLHTWITMTASTMPNADSPIVHDTLSQDVPKLALVHPPLLSAIFALSAFHLTTLEPQHASQHMVTARKYTHLTFRQHNAAIVLLSRENADRIALTCFLLTVIIFRDLDSLPTGADSLNSSSNGHAMVNSKAQALSIASGLTQRLMISNAASLRLSDAFVWAKEDTKSLTPRVITCVASDHELNNSDCNQKDQMSREQKADEASWPREFGHAFRHLLDPSANMGPVETTMRDAGPMTEELWDPGIRNCYEEVLGRIGEIHAAVGRKHESTLALCARLVAFPGLLPKRFFQLLQEGRPRSLVILAQFFAAAKAVESVWWVGDAGRVEVHAIWESLDERWKGQMGEALRMVHTNRE